MVALPALHLRRSLARRLRGALPAVALVIAASAAPANAAWTPAVNVSPSTPDTADPAVAVGGNGYRVAAWLRGDGLNQRVQFSTRSASFWSALEYASPAGRDVDDPQVAVDADGDAIFVWRRFNGLNWVVEARTRSAAGVLGAIQTLSSSGHDAFEPQVRVDGPGNSVFTWRRVDSFGISRVYARHRSAAGDPRACSDAVERRPGRPRSAPGDHVVGRRGGGLAAVRRGQPARRGEGVACRRDRRRAAQTLRRGGRRRRAGGRVRGGCRGCLRLDGVRWREPAGPDAAHGWLRRARTGTDRLGRRPGRARSRSGDRADGERRPDLCRLDGTNWRIQAQSESVDGAASAVSTLSASGGDALDPRVAVNSSGHALIAWRRFDGSRWSLQSRERDRAGALLGTRGHSGDHDAFDPRVAMNTSGEALLAWRPDNNVRSAYGIAVRRRLADGRYAAVEPLFSGYHSAREEQVAVAPDGSAVMAWRRSDGPAWRIEGRRRGADGTLGPVVLLGPGELDEAHLRVVVDADGDALATWDAPSESGYPGVMARAWNADGTLGPTQRVTSSGRRAEIAMTSGGETFIAWEQWAADHAEVVGRNRLADGTFGPAVRLSRVGGWGFAPEVARSAAGRTIIAWKGYVGTGNEPVEVRSRAADGTLSPVQSASPNEVVGEHDVAVADNGAGYVMWRRDLDGRYAVRGRGIGATDQLGALQGLTPTTTNAIRPQVAPMANGRWSPRGWCSRRTPVAGCRPASARPTAPWARRAISPARLLSSTAPRASPCVAPRTPSSSGHGTSRNSSSRSRPGSCRRPVCWVRSPACRTRRGTPGARRSPRGCRCCRRLGGARRANGSARPGVGRTLSAAHRSGRVDGAEKEGLVFRASWVEPSIGLEPMTPSLPWKCRCADPAYRCIPMR